MVQQTLVNVADLFHVQRAVADALGQRLLAHLAAGEEQPVQHFEHDLVGNAETLGLQRREAPGMEEVAAVGHEFQVGMLATLVQQAAGGQKTRPGVGSLTQPLQLFVGFQFAPEVRQTVSLIVKQFAVGQQVVLLGVQQKDHPHHDDQRHLVEFGVGPPAQKLPAALPVGGVESGDEALQSLAHLPAQLVGHVYLSVLALPRQGKQQFLPRPAETLDVQQSAESVEGALLVGEGLGGKGDGRRRQARRGVGEAKILAVGEHAQQNAGLLQQRFHLRDRRGLPASGLRLPTGQFLRGRIHDAGATCCAPTPIRISPLSIYGIGFNLRIDKRGWCRHNQAVDDNQRRPHNGTA